MTSAEEPVKIVAPKPQWFDEKFSASSTGKDAENVDVPVAEDANTNAETPSVVKKRPTTSSLRENSSPSPSQARERSQTSHSAIPFAETSQHRELSEHREASTHSYSASAATYRRHDKLAASANALLELLLRHQRTPQLEYVQEDEQALRLALHNLRDQCVSANKRVLEKEMALAVASPRPGAVAPPFVTSGESVELHCCLAVVFANSLCFEEQPERLSVQALQRLLDRFRAAQAAGDVAHFQRVIVEAVNEVLLYTPLDLEPHLNHAEPSIRRERDCGAAPTPSKSRATDGNISMTSYERLSTQLRETELNFFSIRSEDDGAADGSGGGVAIKASGCVPWKTYFHTGYLNYLRQQGLISGEEADSAPHIVLPCDRWFSAATAYEQFVQLLIALYFSRGADLLNHTARVHKLVQLFDLHTAWAATAEVPAHPMDIVGLDLVTESGDGASPVSVGEVAADVEALPEPEPEPQLEEEAKAVDEGKEEPKAEEAQRELEYPGEETKAEEEPQDEHDDEEEDEMQEAEEAETEDEQEDKIELYKQQQKKLQEKHTGVIYYFHNEDSPHRGSRSRSRPQEEEAPTDPPAAAAAPEPAAEEPESDEKKPFERRHKCYAAGEAPPEHLEGKKRIVVEKITTKEEREELEEQAQEAQKEEEEEPEVEAVPVKRVEGGSLQLPEGTVQKSRQ